MASSNDRLAAGPEEAASGQQHHASGSRAEKEATRQPQAKRARPESHRRHTGLAGRALSSLSGIGSRQGGTVWALERGSPGRVVEHVEIGSSTEF